MKARYIILLSLGILWFWTFWGDLLAGSLSGVFARELSATDLARAAQWGDSFGPLNALASAAAFTVVLATLIVQGRDIHRQRFESSFFELLRLMRELRNDIQFSFSPEYRTDLIAKYPNRRIVVAKQQGFDGVRAANREMMHWTKGDKIQGREELGHIYMEKVHKRHEATIAPYFRLIYTILHRIRTDKVLTQDEKFRYGNLVRSQLTSDELKLLAYNGLAPVSKDLETLIVEFRMLKYLPSSSVRNRLKNIYATEAFSARD